jgi:hypothetical protein
MLGDMIRITDIVCECGCEGAIGEIVYFSEEDQGDVETYILGSLYGTSLYPDNTETIIERPRVL